MEVIFKMLVVTLLFACVWTLYFIHTTLLDIWKEMSLVKMLIRDKGEFK